jgi:hypothetical protein
MKCASALGRTGTSYIGLSNRRPRVTVVEGSKLIVGAEARAFDLRPKRAGEVLDEAIRLGRMGFWRIAPIVVLGSIPPIALAWLVVISIGGDDTNGSTILGGIVVLALLLPFSILLLTGASVIDLYHQAMGTPITRRASLRATVRRVPALFVHLIVLFIVQLIAQIGVNLATSIPSIAVSALFAQVPLLGGILTVILLIGVYLLQFVILGRFVLGIPAVVIDRTGPFAAVGRSFRLTEKQSWSTGLVLFYWSLLSIAIGFVVTIPIAVVASVILPDSVTPVMLVVGYVAVGLAGYTFFSALIVILFINSRVRNEGLDLQLSADRLGFPDVGPIMPLWAGQPGMFVPQSGMYAPPPGVFVPQHPPSMPSQFGSSQG